MPPSTGSPIAPWPKHPVLYEINTWVWLGELAAAIGRPVTLASVPAAEWDRLAGLGADAIWLMGVWQRSPEGRTIALDNPGLLADFRSALPDFTAADVVGSPYCVRGYAVDEHLGGPSGLRAARRALAERGLRLVLDFVPNHVAPDHPWTRDHPACFVKGEEADLERDPASFRRVAGRVIACGRDPFFPAWPDVLQLDAFAPGLRDTAAATLLDIASQCDAVRCDMAMLFMNDIFARTWGPRVGPAPATEYWPTVIAAVKGRHPDFRFIAEAYWDREWALQQQGFDYCYDKRLLDRLSEDSAESVRGHLQAEMAYQVRLVRFVENHDEPRAAATFGPEQARAAAATFATLPGARLFHEGQLEGHRVRLPVFLGRRPTEPTDPGVRAFYRKLLRAVHTPALRDGEWRLLERTGWPDNETFREVVAWAWERGRERRVIVVNLSARPAQARVRFPWPDLAGGRLTLADALTDEVYERDGGEAVDPGLYVDLPGWGVHFLAVDGRRSG
jgi:alpha amylase-like protein